MSQIIELINPWGENKPYKVKASSRVYKNGEHKVYRQFHRSYE